MTPEVKAEYHRMLARVVLKHGNLVRANPSIYGWQEYDWSTPDGSHAHMAACSASAWGTPEETYWQEFQGTFYEGDTSVHGVEIEHVTCACGLIKDRSYRWNATVSEVATAVFEELWKETRT